MGKAGEDVQLGAIAGFMCHISALKNSHKTGETYFWICLVKVALEGWHSNW